MKTRSILTNTLRRIGPFRRLLNLPQNTLYLPALTENSPPYVSNTFFSKAILHLEGGYIWGNQGTVLSGDRRVVDGLSREFEHVGHELSIFKQCRIKPATQVDGRAGVVTTAGSNVYYHWMIDVFPRLYILIKSGLVDKLDHICVTLTGDPFQLETLKWLNIDKGKLINTLSFSTHYQFRQLFIPVYFSPVNKVSAFAIEGLRTTFLREPSPAFGLRIFVPRKGHRKLQNTSMLEELLRSCGFKVIFPEQYSIIEQARIFSEASTIVGVHGSALTNLVFCRPSTRIIEIMPPKWQNQCFADISEKASLDYYCITGKGMNTDVKISKSEDFYLDYGDIKTLMTMVNQAL